jgi:hypothetical protein
MNEVDSVVGLYISRLWPDKKVFHECVIWIPHNRNEAALVARKMVVKKGEKTYSV